MEPFIRDKIIIDIDTAPNWDKVYSGICLVANENFILFINFDFEKGEFDGYSLLKNQDFEQYRLWEEEDYKDLKNDNSQEFLNAIDLEKFSDFDSALDYLQGEIIAFYTFEDLDTFYVGKLLSTNENSIKVNLIDTEAQWIGKEVIRRKDISYLGFSSSYEKEICEKLE